MADGRSRVGGGDGQISTEAVDVRRYMEALRRSRRLILAIIVALTGTVLALSLALPKNYEATATLLFQPDTTFLGSTDPESLKRELTSLQKLINTPQVVSAASRKVSGTTSSDVDSALSSAVDENANIIYVFATDRNPDKAADIANAVAASFLTLRRSTERARLTVAEAQATDQIDSLQAQGGSPEEIAALQRRLSDLQVQEANAGSDLQLAEKAEAPSAPSSPRPVRNTVLALIASLFIGVLVALGRDQLVPRPSGGRELSQLTGLPVLAAIPYVGRTLGKRRHSVQGSLENEAYHTLRTAVSAVVPPSRTAQVVLVTSAVNAEGKTTVTARLGWALALAGHRTLLVSGDLRRPSLHQRLDAPADPGLGDLLSVMDRLGRVDDELISAAITPVTGGSGVVGDRVQLDLLASGSMPGDPTRILSSGALPAVLDLLRQRDYAYILVDSPPMLGIADTQVLARHTDHVLLVARLDRIRLDNVIDLNDVLERLGISPIGLVVIGAREPVSPYYLSERSALIETPTARSGR